MTKNIDIDKCKYSRYGIAFDRGWTFSVPGGFNRNVTIFGVGISSSVHIYNNKGKMFWFLVKVQKPFLSDNFRTYNMNDNPKNDGKKKNEKNSDEKNPTIPQYFDANICHHFQPKI